MSRSHAFSPLLLGLFLAASACQSAAASDDADDGALVIDPHGTDNPGKVQATLPTGAVAPVEVTLTTKVGAEHSEKREVGQIFDRVPVGTHTLSFASGGDYPVLTTARVPVTAGATAIVKGALIAVDATKGPRTLGLGRDAFGSAPTFELRGANGVNTLGAIKPTANGSTAMGVAAGKYTIRYGLFGMDGVDVDAAEDGSLKVALTDLAGRRVARVVAPAARQMPDADCGVAAGFLFRSPGSPSVERPATLAPGESIDVGARESVAGASYEVRSTLWADFMPLPLGMAGQGPTKLTLTRIDVDDVLVNDTLPRVRGTYRIVRLASDGSPVSSLLKCSPATKTGVDVPPGKYRIEVAYPTTDSGTKVDVQVTDVP